MSLVQLVVQDGDVIPACACLVKGKAVHLVDRASVAPALREGTPAFFSSVHADLEMLGGAIAQLLQWIRDELGEVPECTWSTDVLIDPPRTAEELKPLILESQTAFDALHARRAAQRAEIARLTRISDTLQSFETAGVSYGEMSSFAYFGFVAGVMPVRYLALLRSSLRQVTYHLEMRRLDESDASVIIITPKDHVAAVRAALRSVYFSEVQVPADYQAHTGEAMDAIELSIWQAREELAAITQELRGRSQRLAPQVLAARARVRANLRVLQAMQLFGKTARTTFINGWVPRQALPRVTNELKTALEGRVLVQSSEPESDEGLAREVVQRGGLRVPTKFRHPAFLKAFEGLVTTYGYPS